MNKQKISKTKGYTFASITALMQGSEGILIMFLGLMFTQSVFQSIGFLSGLLAIKEIITFLIVLIVLSPKRIWELIKLLIRQKESRLFLYAGFFGTGIGNLSYILAIQLAGPAYGVVLTSLYPVFALTINHFLLSNKYKESWKVWTGVLISTIGAALFIILPTVVEGNTISSKHIIGIIFGGLAGLFWAIEGTILSRGMKKKKNKDIRIIDGVAIRSMATVLFSTFLFLPVSTIIHKTNTSSEIFTDPLHIIGELFMNWKSIIITISIAVNIVILRQIHLIAIKSIGIKLTSIIDTNNFLVTPLFSIFLSYTNMTFLNSSESLFISPVWWSWLLIIPIILGVIMVFMFKHKDEKEIMEKIVS